MKKVNTSAAKITAIIVLLLLTLSQAFAKIETVLGNLPLERNDNIVALPLSVYQVPEILISREQYLISWNRQRRLLNWTAWKLEAQNLGHVGRSNNFLADPDLEAYLSQSGQHAVTSADFTGSCFDRGHQCPSADRDDSIANNEMTFLMSNMIPQTAYLNRVIWEHLEQYTRDLVSTQGKTAYIIAGPIYDQDFGKIGPNQDIPIPSKDFKVIILLDKNQTIKDVNRNTPMIAVIMPNILRSGKRPLDDRAELCSNRNLSPGSGVTGTNSVNDWQQYQTTLAEVERLSGFKILN